MLKLNAQELRTTSAAEEQKKLLQKNPIYIICDNVIDTYNIGSIFRLADAVAAEKVFLCGVSETPPHTRIKKASINTTEWVAWSYTSTAVEALQEVKSQNAKVKIVAIEQDARSVSFQKVHYSFPIALVVGNETTGVSKQVLDMADMIVEIPMWGVNKSLNVMVSLGIVLYEVMRYNSSYDSFG